MATRFSFELAKVAEKFSVKLDARGLIPLDDARRWLAQTTAYVRESADQTWAALLSLESAEEFVRAASALEWKFPMLRGWDNEDAVRRYGEGALPWLETLLDRIKGRVGAIPALPFNFVGSHLLALGGDAAGAALRVKLSSDADPDGLGFVVDWLKRQKADGWAGLVRLAESGNPEAKRALDVLEKRDPKGVARVLKQVGVAVAKKKKAELTVAGVLHVLDAAAAAPMGARIPWPSLHPTSGHFEPHAWRVVTVRQEKGDHWGVLIEVVQGDLLDPKVKWPAVVQRYTYGSKVQSGGRYVLDAKRLKVNRRTKVTEELIETLDLRAGQSVTGAVESWKDVLLIRHALARDPGVFFAPAEKAAKVLKVPKGKVVSVVTKWEHVDGTALGKDEHARLPSSSVAWKSLAEALVARDASKFQAGAVNTEWRSLLPLPATAGRGSG
ncbi:MAG: hypothetical protein U0228_07245 [Myxococcaceae bacterium]